MYEAHFGFNRQPFQSADACRAFFVSESIQEVLPQLLHALRSDLGIAVLTGIPGSGKTTLLRHIQQQLSKEGRVIVCSGANLGTSADLVSALLQASRLTGGSESPTKSVAVGQSMPGSRSSALDYMKRTAELWGPVLLLIDDVQLVPLPVLNELRACTEEEWNGRDLIRCLVSAPITFEDQLARQEYADFARRIRCHAFLQPLKSSESFLFLKEQIEIAGGRVSNVFTTAALESITAAAAGNPRCLGLLADETLVVAAMVGEKIASEKSVRTALSRLQHLQYNWNSSPHEDVQETTELDSELTQIEATPTNAEMTIASSSSVLSNRTVPASTGFSVPIQATIAPGVIEFGGPAISTTRAGNSSYRFAAMEVPVAVKTGNTVPAFEVGQRFASESTQEAISIDDVEDREILELLNLGVELDLDLAHVPNPSMETPPVSEPVDFPEARIVWFNGNADTEETQTPVETISANAAVDDNTSLPPAEGSPVNAALPAAKSQSDRSEPESDNVNTSGKFFDAASTKLSNRLPVFDRYTWLALGREVPAGRSSAVSMSVARQLIQADYSLQSYGPLTAISSSSTFVQRATSIDQIAITLTTDGALSEEIARNSLNAQSGVYLAIGAEDSIAHEISTTLESAKSMLHATSQDETQCDETQCDDETHNEETCNINSPESSNDVTPENSADANRPSNSGLRIWRDGILVFSNGKPTDEFAPQDSSVLSHEAKSPDHQAIETPHQASSAQSLPLDESSLQHTALQLSAGGFFTLPDPKPQHADELSSLKISKDEDVYPFVEAINNMRADVRSFQNTGSVPVEDSDSVTRFSQADDSAAQSDNVISRAKRRLDDRTTSADTKTMSLQIAPEVRRQQKTTSEAESVATSDATSDATLSTESAPKFGSLFTRLRETRKRAADQAQADAK